MTTLRLTLAAAALLALAPAVQAQTPLTYTRMVAETGCDSKFSEEKKADVFAAKYKGNQMLVAGEIATVSKGAVGLKLLPSTFTYDVSIKLADPKATYDLEKGARLKVMFAVDSAGGCFLPYGGTDGVIQQ